MQIGCAKSGRSWALVGGENVGRKGVSRSPQINTQACTSGQSSRQRIEDQGWRLKLRGRGGGRRKGARSREAQRGGLKGSCTKDEAEI